MSQPNSSYKDDFSDEDETTTTTTTTTTTSSPQSSVRLRRRKQQQERNPQDDVDSSSASPSSSSRTKKRKTKKKTKFSDSKNETTTNTSSKNDNNDDEEDTTTDGTHTSSPIFDQLGPNGRLYRKFSQSGVAIPLMQQQEEDEDDRLDDDRVHDGDDDDETTTTTSLQQQQEGRISTPDHLREKYHQRLLQEENTAAATTEDHNNNNNQTERGENNNHDAHQHEDDDERNKSGGAASRRSSTKAGHSTRRSQKSDTTATLTAGSDHDENGENNNKVTITPLTKGLVLSTTNPLNNADNEDHEQQASVTARPSSHQLDRANSSLFAQVSDGKARSRPSFLLSADEVEEQQNGDGNDERTANVESASSRKSSMRVVVPARVSSFRENENENTNSNSGGAFPLSSSQEPQAMSNPNSPTTTTTTLNKPPPVFGEKSTSAKILSIERLTPKIVSEIENSFNTLSKENFTTRCDHAYRRYFLRPTVFQYSTTDEARSHQVSPPRPHFKTPPPAPELCDHPIFVKPLVCTAGDVQSVLFRSGVHRIPPIPRLMKFIYKAVRQVQLGEEYEYDKFCYEVNVKREQETKLYQKYYNSRSASPDSSPNTTTKRRRSTKNSAKLAAMMATASSSSLEEVLQRIPNPLAIYYGSANNNNITTTTHPLLMKTIGQGKDLENIRLTSEIVCLVAEQMQRVSSVDCWEDPQDVKDRNQDASLSLSRPGSELGFSETRRRVSVVSVVESDDDEDGNHDNNNKNTTNDSQNSILCADDIHSGSMVFKGVSTAMMQFKRSLNLQRQKKEMMSANSPTGFERKPSVLGSAAAAQQQQKEQERKEQQQQQRKPSQHSLLITAKLKAKREQELLEKARLKENKKQAKKLKKLVRTDSFGAEPSAVMMRALEDRKQLSSSSSSSSSSSAADENNNIVDQIIGNEEEYDHGFGEDDDDDTFGDSHTDISPGEQHHQRSRRGSGFPGGGRDLNLALDRPMLGDDGIFGDNFNENDIVITTDDIKDRLREVVRGAVKELKQQRKQVHEWMDTTGVDRRGRLKTAAVPSAVVYHHHRSGQSDSDDDHDDDDASDTLSYYTSSSGMIEDNNRRESILSQNNDKNRRQSQNLAEYSFGVGAALHPHERSQTDPAFVPPRSYEVSMNPASSARPPSKHHHHHHKKQQQQDNTTTELTPAQRHAQEVMAILAKQKERNERNQQQQQQQVRFATSTTSTPENNIGDDHQNVNDNRQQQEDGLLVQNDSFGGFFGGAGGGFVSHEDSGIGIGGGGGGGDLAKSMTFGSFALASLRRSGSTVGSLDEAALRPPKIWTRYGPVSPVIKTGSHIEAATLDFYRHAAEEERKYDERMSRHDELFESRSRQSQNRHQLSSSSATTASPSTHHSQHQQHHHQPQPPKMARTRSISGLTQEQSQRIHALATGPWATNAALFNHKNHQQHPHPHQQKNDNDNNNNNNKSAVDQEHHESNQNESVARDQEYDKRFQKNDGRRPSLPDKPSWVSRDAPPQVSSARERNSYERHVSMMRCRPPREIPRDFFIKSVNHPKVLKRPVSARIAAGQKK